MAEIPGQFLSYMKSKGIKPNPPISRPPRPDGSVQHQQPPPYPTPTAGTAPYPTTQPPYPLPPTSGGGGAPYPSAPYPSQPMAPPYPTGP